ncbi:MAG: pilin [Candidatus Parcubacteria bacterium]|nr:pilin [Candidatus Parcubacteria bacterium]
MKRKKLFSILIYSYFLLFLFFSSFVFVKNVWATTCYVDSKPGTCKATCDITEDQKNDFINCTDLFNVYCCVPKTAGATCVSPSSCATTCPADRQGSFAENSWCANNQTPKIYCCKPAPAATQPPPTTTAGTTGGTAGPLQLQLQIPIGNLSLMTISGSSIGQYIKAVFVFGSATTVALAIIMVMAGGVKWILSGGEPNKIGEAKDTILKALLGMFIALFAVFMLQTISPGTVTFQPITPEFIAGMANPTGGGAPNPQDIVANECNLKNPRASCFAEACDQLTPARVVSTAGGTCETAKPNCCAETGPVITCQDKSGCASNQYCASAGTGQPGRCFDKRDLGANCKENIVGGTHFETWLGGGANDVCISGSCVGWTSAGINICVPKSGTGIVNNPCTDSNQCSPHFFCASENFKIGNKTDSGKKPKPDKGTCQKKIPKGDTTTVCQDWEVNSSTDNGACDSGACPFYFLGKATCQE